MSNRWPAGLVCLALILLSGFNIKGIPELVRHQADLHGRADSTMLELTTPNYGTVYFDWAAWPRSKGTPEFELVLQPQEWQGPHPQHAVLRVSVEHFDLDKTSILTPDPAFEESDVDVDIRGDFQTIPLCTLSGNSGSALVKVAVTSPASAPVRIIARISVLGSQISELLEAADVHDLVFGRIEFVSTCLSVVLIVLIVRRPKF